MRHKRRHSTSDEDPDVRGLSEALAREFEEDPEAIESASEEVQIQDPAEATIERVDE
jgi:hypothetical protein